MKRDIHDERLVAVEQKIMSEVGRLLLWGILLSLIIQQWVFKATREQYLPELICLLAASAYSIIRRLTLGVGFFGRKNTKLVIPVTAVTTGLTVAVLTWYPQREAFAADPWHAALVLGGTFLCGAGVTVLIYAIILVIDHARKRSVQKHLDKLDDDN